MRWFLVAGCGLAMACAAPTAPVPEVDLTCADGAGEAIEVSLQPGQHLAPAGPVDRGCPLVLPPGTYGVAVYSVVGTPPPSASERVARVPVRVTVDATTGSFTPTSLTAAPVTATALAPDWRAAIGVPAHAGQAATCDPHNDPGGSVELSNAVFVTDAALEPRSLYRNIARSAHFVARVRDRDLATLAALPAGSVEAFLAALEDAALPHLNDLFGPVPDADGDGLVAVQLVSMIGAAGFMPYRGSRVDGCPAEEIWLSLAALERPVDDPSGATAVFVHEMTHLFDAAGGPLGNKADWSIEGYAALVQNLWLRRRLGAPEWDDDYAGPISCDTCFQLILKEGRYGAPGLAAGEAVNGATILEYLAQQATAPPAPWSRTVGHFRYRGGGVGLRPAFEAAGGQGRDEATLQGEFLLMLYADGNVAGASTRLRQQALDLPSYTEGPGLSSPFPLRAFTLDPRVATSRPLSLALPDGIVFELVVPAGGSRVLRIETVQRGLALAVVRRL